jgi:CDP-diacylglycerol--glycerol-3-phosphate 3-phosphatidyltransferase
VIAPVLAVLYGQLPIWYLLISAARYLFVVGQWLLKRQGRAIYNLTSSTTRRAMAGFHMGFVGVILLPIFSPPGTHIAATLFMLPFLGGFVRDWSVVSGAISPESSLYTRVLSKATSIFSHWLPVVLRGLTLCVVVWVTSNMSRFEPDGQMSLSQPQFLLLIWLMTLLLVAGLAGRVAALGLLLVVGWITGRGGLDTEMGILIGCAAILVMSGTGKMSLYKPEENFLRHRAGEKNRT